MDAPAAPMPDAERDRKALLKCRRMLESRYSGVVILVTEGEGKNTRNDSEQAGNQNLVEHLVEKFSENDFTFEESEESDDDEDEDEDRWKREGRKGDGPEPA